MNLNLKKLKDLRKNYKLRKSIKNYSLKDVSNILSPPNFSFKNITLKHLIYAFGTVLIVLFLLSNRAELKNENEAQKQIIEAITEESKNTATAIVVEHQSRKEKLDSIFEEEKVYTESIKRDRPVQTSNNVTISDTSSLPDVKPLKSDKQSSTSVTKAKPVREVKEENTDEIVYSSNIDPVEYNQTMSRKIELIHKISEVLDEDIDSLPDLETL